MTTIPEMLQRVQTLHAAIANDLCPNGDGGRLICDPCETEMPITANDVGQYLRHGWPKCELCGSGLRWETAKERTP